MNFTREPIIETIISAKDGYKLSIKNSKNLEREEYTVDAVEVVSFGGSFFYRSQEYPKIFFLPTNDYEIIEVRENRLLIKQPSLEKSIKIGAGKDVIQQVKVDKSLIDKQLADKPAVDKSEKEQKKVVKPAEDGLEEQKDQSKSERKRHRRTKRARTDINVATSVDIAQQPQIKSDEQKETPSFSMESMALLQPPSSLIFESLQKYKKREELSLASEVLEDLTAHENLTVKEKIVFQQEKDIDIKEQLLDNNDLFNIDDEKD